VIADPDAPERPREAVPEPDHRGAAQPGEGPTEPAPRPSVARRFAPWLLVAGAAAAAFTLVPHLPKERRVELRLDQVSTIVDVELSFARSRDGEPVQGNAWHFAAGRAPLALTLSVNLPDGQYEVDIAVQRTDGRQLIHRVISVTDSDVIAIPVR
jgi:hypothetical protein